MEFQKKKYTFRGMDGYGGYRVVRDHRTQARATNERLARALREGTKMPRP